MKPKILIDVTRSPNSGIGKYSWSLFEHLYHVNNHFEFFGLTLPEYQEYATSKSLETITIAHNPQNFQEVRHLSKLIHTSADVYVATGFTQIVFPKIPIIQVVHDLIFMSHPQWNPTVYDFRVNYGKGFIKTVKRLLIPIFKFLLRGTYGRWREALNGSTVTEVFVLGASYAILRASALVTVSQTTQEDVLKYYDITQPIRTIYPILKKTVAKSHFRRDSKDLVILYIANFEPRKNHRVAFEAIAALPEHIRSRTKLILLGKVSYESHHQQFMEQFNRFKEQIHIECYNGISEQKKQELLANVSFLLFPSLCEGFGLPLLEAMLHELPIIAYDTSIAREICGSGAMYVSENNGSAFAQAIMNYYQIRSNGNWWRQQQREQVKKFDPSQVNSSMTKLIQQILS